MSMRHCITTLITRATIRYRRPIATPTTTLSISSALLPPRPLSASAALKMSSPPSPSTTSAAPSAENPLSSPSPPSPPPQSKSESESEPEPALPPLSASEFREYNRMAEHMDIFHAHFRSTWNTLYTTASSGRRPQGMSIRTFIQVGLEFVQHLEVHHSIEERYVFPDLATRMPEFRTGKERNLPKPKSGAGAGRGEHEGEEEARKSRKKAAELLQQHVEIHKGMDGLAEYLRRCLTGETELQMSVLKTQLDSWGTVLFTHLDQEVRTLGAENMRRYWTLDEMRRMRM